MVRSGREIQVSNISVCVLGSSLLGNNRMKQLRNRETARLSVPVRIDVTALISPVSCLARYCSQPEVKFDAFIRLKRGKEQ